MKKAAYGRFMSDEIAFLIGGNAFAFTFLLVNII